MSNHDFTLKSGEILHLSTPSFETAIELVEAVKQATAGMDAAAELDSAIFGNPSVRKALYGCFRWAMWGIHQVGPQLFDDPRVAEKARGDYFEICSRVIEVASAPFFLNLSLRSTTSPLLPKEGQGSQ